MTAGISTLRDHRRAGRVGRGLEAAPGARLIEAARRVERRRCRSSGSGRCSAALLRGRPVELGSAKGADTTRFARVPSRHARTGVSLAPSQFEAGFLLDRAPRGRARCDARSKPQAKAITTPGPRTLALRGREGPRSSPCTSARGRRRCQRPLKLAQYLPALGIETHVLAPDDPKGALGPGAARPTQAWVHRARYIGPRAASRRRRAPGRPRSTRLATQVPRVPAAARARRERDVERDRHPGGDPHRPRKGIDAVLTTSPPGSVHLVGAAVQQATRRALARRSPRLARRQPAPARDIGRRARQERRRERVARSWRAAPTRSPCVSEPIADEARALGPRGPVRTIANGCDFDDFAGLEYRPAPRFRITHTGSFFGKRDPRPFLQALARLRARHRGALRRRLPARPTASGPRRSGSATGSSSSTTPRAAERSRAPARLEALPARPGRRGRGKGVLSGRCSSTSPPSARSSRPCRRTVPPPTDPRDRRGCRGGARRRRRDRRRSWSPRTLRERRPAHCGARSGRDAGGCRQGSGRGDGGPARDDRGRRVMCMGCMRIPLSGRPTPSRSLAPRPSHRFRRAPPADRPHGQLRQAAVGARRRAVALRRPPRRLPRRLPVGPPGARRGRFPRGAGSRRCSSPLPARLPGRLLHTSRPRRRSRSGRRGW